MIVEALVKSKIKEININNLQHGLDSKGADMPFYANSEYGFEKMMINPKNRGHWDLKNTGQYYEGIVVKIKRNEVVFSQKFRNKKIDWLNLMLERANRNPLGITKEQMEELQVKNIPILREKILNIINGK